MSLILDALKKLDREKSYRRRRVINIATDILKSDYYYSKKRFLRYFIAIFVTALFASAITYTLIEKFGLLSKSSPPASIDAPLPSKTIKVPQYQPPPPQTFKEAQEKRNDTPIGIQTPKESKIPIPQSKEERENLSVIRKDLDSLPKESKKTTEREIISPPSLTISAIAWSEEPSERIAMINDKIVREGSEIQGAKILEILPHQVRFFYNGKTFEVSLSPR